MSEAVCTITDWKVRGRGEFIRIILEAGGIKYNNKVVEENEWSELKKTIPFGFLPCLTDTKTNITISQTSSLVNYAAKKAGFYPDDIIIATQCEMYIQSINEMFADAGSSYLKNGLPGFEEWLKTGLIKKLQVFEDIILKNKTNWLVSNKMTFADLVLFAFLETFQGIEKIIIDNKFTSIHKIYKSILDLDNIKNYYKSDRMIPKLDVVELNQKNIDNIQLFHLQKGSSPVMGFLFQIPEPKVFGEDNKKKNKEKSYCMVDAGFIASFKLVEKHFQKMNIKWSQLKYIFITHRHADHVGGLAAVQKKNPNVKIILHKNAVEDIVKGKCELGMMKGDSHFANMAPKLMGLAGLNKFPATKINEKHDLILDLDEKNTPTYDIEKETGIPAIVYYLPGHSDCSIGLKLKDDSSFFVGDAIMMPQRFVKPGFNPIVFWNKQKCIESMEIIANSGVKNLLLAHCGSCPLHKFANWHAKTNKIFNK